jgi:acetylglutamate kinase
MKTLKVIKIGGNIINDSQALQEFLKQFAVLEGPKILVHGGGKLATKMAEDLSIPVTMKDGRRVTDAATLDIITMVYAGKINKNIVAQLQVNQCNSVGFTGADGNTILSTKRPAAPVDFGYVGDVQQVNTSVVETLVEQNITPVFCAITHDSNGQLLNTNADTIAAQLSIAFAQAYHVELYYCFEKNGVLKNITDEDSVITHITSESYKTLLNEGIFAEGMLPKMTNCMDAVQQKVSKVCIGKPAMLFSENQNFTTITQ